MLSRRRRIGDRKMRYGGGSGSQAGTIPAAPRHRQATPRRRQPFPPSSLGAAPPASHGPRQLAIRASSWLPTWVGGDGCALRLYPEQPGVVVFWRRRPSSLVGPQSHPRVKQRGHALPAHCAWGGTAGAACETCVPAGPAPRRPSAAGCTARGSGAAGAGRSRRRGRQACTRQTPGGSGGAGC